MARFGFVLLMGALLFVPERQAPACSLCGIAIKKDTLGQEIDRAKIVLYGYATNPQFSNDAGAIAGSGTTDFNIEKTLKSDPFLGETRVLKLDRYLPVTDPKSPPRYLLFCDVHKGKLNPYHGRSLTSTTLLDYLEAAKPFRAKDRVEALLHYSQFLDHADPALAEDAFLEFAKSNDAEVSQAAKRLKPERFRALLKNAQGDPDRVGLYAFLLGACGADQDADFLRGLIDRPTPELRKALDGLLCGYIALLPKEGWKCAHALAADTKQDFTTRYAVLRACRFLYNCNMKEHRAPVLSAFKAMLPDPEMADLAIEDLRSWKVWDLTPEVLGYFGKESHDAPITRRTLGRYALSCPLPEARQFVERLRKLDRELITDLEEALMFEQGK